MINGSYPIMHFSTPTGNPSLDLPGGFLGITEKAKLIMPTYRVGMSHHIRPGGASSDPRFNNNWGVASMLCFSVFVMMEKGAKLDKITVPFSFKDDGTGNNPIMTCRLNAWMLEPVYPQSYAPTRVNFNHLRSMVTGSPDRGVTFAKLFWSTNTNLSIHPEYGIGTAFGLMMPKTLGGLSTTSMVNPGGIIGTYAGSSLYQAQETGMRHLLFTLAPTDFVSTFQTSQFINQGYNVATTRTNFVGYGTNSNNQLSVFTALNGNVLTANPANPLAATWGWANTGTGLVLDGQKLQVV